MIDTKSTIKNINTQSAIHERICQNKLQTKAETQLACSF